MLKVLLSFWLAIITISMMIADPASGAEALLVTALMSGVAIVVFRRHTDEKDFVTYIFLGALAARLAFGLFLHSFDLRMFAGPRLIFYDIVGNTIADYWQGYPVSVDVNPALSIRGPGWGMNYLMGFLYLIPGRSILVAQTFCGVIGAATVPMVYYCSQEIYHNKRVAKAAAIGVAFFPAFVIWSSQLLKDGLIVFLLVVIMTMILRLQQKFSWASLLVLILGMVGVMSLRFYTFYVVVFAVLGGFLIGVQTSFKATIQRMAILSIVAIALIYVGFIRIATVDLSTYGSLERLQVSRNAMGATSESGYGIDTDVSTTGGALSALPVGFANLMFAPFPWDMKNFRQSLTLPDVLLWWSLIPLLGYGLWYTLRTRLRQAIPILIFTLILTVAYSMFQSNLGAAYRQRTQIQVFLFMFIAVGWGLMRERMDDKKRIEEGRRRDLERQLQTRLQQRQVL